MFTSSSSSHPFALSHEDGCGMYCPSSLSHSSEVLARSRPSSMALKSCSSGFILTQALSARPLLRFLGYLSQNSSKSCSCLLLLKGDLGLPFAFCSSSVAATSSEASTPSPSGVHLLSCAASDAHIYISFEGEGEGEGEGDSTFSVANC